MTQAELWDRIRKRWEWVAESSGYSIASYTLEHAADIVAQHQNVKAAEKVLRQQASKLMEIAEKS